MRLPASEKLEIIRLVEQSHMPVTIDPAVEHRWTSAELVQRSPYRQEEEDKRRRRKARKRSASRNPS